MNILFATVLFICALFTALSKPVNAGKCFGLNCFKGGASRSENAVHYSAGGAQAPPPPPPPPQGAPVPAQLNPAALGYPPGDRPMLDHLEEIWREVVGTPKPDNAHGNNPGAGNAHGNNPGAGNAHGNNPGAGNAHGNNPGAGNAHGNNPGAGNAHGNNPGAGNAHGNNPGVGNHHANAGPAGHHGNIGPHVGLHPIQTRGQRRPESPHQGSPPHSPSSSSSGTSGLSD